MHCGLETLMIALVAGMTAVAAVVAVVVVAVAGIVAEPVPLVGRAGVVAAVAVAVAVAVLAKVEVRGERTPWERGLGIHLSCLVGVEARREAMVPALK